MLAGGLKHHRRSQEHGVLPALQDALGADAWRELGERLAASMRTDGSASGAFDPARAK